MKVYQLMLLACVCILSSQAVLAKDSSHERLAQDKPNNVIKVMPAKTAISRDNLSKSDLHPKRPERKTTPANRTLPTKGESGHTLPAKNMTSVKPHSISKTAPSTAFQANGRRGLEAVTSCIGWWNCWGFRTACEAADGVWKDWGAGAETCTTKSK